MITIDRGTGCPVVFVPGIQGRWEWMEPAIDALARHCRVLTFSLADEPSSGCAFDARRGFDAYLDQIRDALDAAGVERAVIGGVSYGGLVAARFAARHPDRVSALLLVSALPPSWTPDRRARFYLRAPRLLSPLFAAQSLRMFREVVAATGGLLPALRIAVRQGALALRYRTSPARMAQRVRSIDGGDESTTAADMDALRQLAAPVLVIAGSPELDRLVPVSRTHEYLRIWPQARAATLERTGHIGVITRPDAFADLVARFVRDAAGGARHTRRRIG